MDSLYNQSLAATEQAAEILYQADTATTTARDTISEAHLELGQLSNIVGGGTTDQVATTVLLRVAEVTSTAILLSQEALHANELARSDEQLASYIARTTDQLEREEIATAAGIVPIGGVPGSAGIAPIGGAPIGPAEGVMSDATDV